MTERMLEPFSPENTEFMLSVADSPYGKALNGQIRYEQYCHIPEGMMHRFLDETRKKEVRDVWSEDWLDADVNNLQHNVFTAVIGNALCKMDGLSDTTTDRVVRALLAHDLKEYVFDPHSDEGDLMYDDAQKLGEAGFANEHKELGELLRSEDFHELSEEEIEDVENIMNDSKCKPPQTEAGRYVEMAERVGYVHTALLADRVSRGAVNIVAELGDEQRRRLDWLGENVLANHIARLVDLAEDYTGVRYVLESRQDEISEALTRLSDPSVQTYVHDYYRKKGQNVEERQMLWENALAGWMQYETTEVL